MKAYWGRWRHVFATSASPRPWKKNWLRVSLFSTVHGSHDTKYVTSSCCMRHSWAISLNQLVLTASKWNKCERSRDIEWDHMLANTTTSRSLFDHKLHSCVFCWGGRGGGECLKSSSRVFGFIRARANKLAVVPIVLQRLLHAWSRSVQQKRSGNDGHWSIPYM